MSEQLLELFEELPTYLGGHMLLSLAALAVGLIVSVPLGIFVSRRPRLGEWALALASIVQTIPSLALLALMVPLLAASLTASSQRLAAVVVQVALVQGTSMMETNQRAVNRS